ncbi:MAG: sugar ABC transporter permease [Anaerolineae bacterium]|nr:sugar ABC transporter permease [Anaerolineae bacterium]MCX8066556.1 sugar ABC transporter permease [Anaerolineae bacterium]MDW7990553.1 sugar ABC transporter permease [Anaerolineae bacterium]
MYVSAWETYYPTLLRWLAVGGGLIGLMILLQKLLRLFGVRREVATGYALILPWILGFLIWNLYPFARSLYLSFTEYNIFQPPKWVGLDNYVRMFRDEQFWLSLRLTLLYAAFNVPLGLAGALGVALLLNRSVSGIGIWRTIYYIPAVLPAAAVALLWRWMLSPESGLINFMLQPVYRGLNIQPLQWFTDPSLVLPAFVIMGMWGVFGANSVILLAGLKNIPKELYEAAELDGAGNWRKFWNVTIPMVSPTLFYNLVTGIIGALQVFTQAFFITIPRRAGTFLNVLIYREAFAYRNMGYASALAWVLLIIILLITLLVFRSSAAWVYYEAEVK